VGAASRRTVEVDFGQVQPNEVRMLDHTDDAAIVRSARQRIPQAIPLSFGAASCIVASAATVARSMK
jgi:hypothetical protein